MDQTTTSANISDSLGDLLLYTNGYYIADASGDTMLNGSGLNPSNYTSDIGNGLWIPQADLILPKPDDPSIYYLFHSTVDDLVNITSRYLYLTTIDMSLNGGLGAVVSKNQILIDDTLNIGKITAVKHGNGRDWWVFCHKVDSDTFFRLLVTPGGISAPVLVSGGSTRPADGGQVAFSPDGSRFASYSMVDDFDLLDFDRCEGTFSNARHVVLPGNDFAGGVAFSPNSQLVYLTSITEIHQFDATASTSSDLAASKIEVAQWDSFYSPAPPAATLFFLAQLAPDGKIYVSTGNGTFHMHLINEPDVAGLGCSIAQHALALPYYNSDGLPNHPNYHLGPLSGSPCDTLGSGISERTPPLHLSAFPNPNNGTFTLSYPAQSVVGELEVRDLSGRLVLRERLPQWSQVHRVQLHEAAGMYQCRITWGTLHTTARVLVER